MSKKVCTRQVIECEQCDRVQLFSLSFQLQHKKTKEKHYFCSKKCRKNWVDMYELFATQSL